MFVTKQLVSDRDTGVKHIMKSLRIKDKDTKLNYSVFQRIFCRSIFKESLIEVLREIEEDTYARPSPKEERKSAEKKKIPSPSASKSSKMVLNALHRALTITEDRRAKVKPG